MVYSKYNLNDHSIDDFPRWIFCCHLWILMTAGRKSRLAFWQPCITVIDRLCLHRGTTHQHRLNLFKEAQPSSRGWNIGFLFYSFSCHSPSPQCTFHLVRADSSLGSKRTLLAAAPATEEGTYRQQLNLSPTASVYFCLALHLANLSGNQTSIGNSASLGTHIQNWLQFKQQSLKKFPVPIL